MRERVGVLGGTFDPVHYGHLAAAMGALHLAGLDRVLFVPAGQNPLKARQPITPGHHRLAMLELAIRGNPAFAISRVDLDRPGPHYTVETLALLAEEYPRAQLHFIAGIDALLEIERWRDYPALLRRWPFLAVTRPGSDLNEWQGLMQRLGPELAGQIRTLTIPGVDIAARDLRARVQAGYPLRYLVPDAVATYVQEHGLYRPAGGAGIGGQPD